MLALLQNPTFIRANLLIMTAGLIKGSVEEMLPFHADHQWGDERLRLRKLALQRCELELLRSHPKDERGSVREIGLCVRMGATLHFLELPPTLSWELTHC